MKIILSRGGNYKDQRFEASDKPQEVPDAFGRAVVARGVATEVKAKKAAAKKAAAPAARTEGDD